MRAFWVSAIFLSLLCGCTSTAPFRSVLVEPGTANCPSKEAARLPHCSNVTPETGDGYELHFVEFDDQGWAASLPTSGLSRKNIKSLWTQTDHLLNRLQGLLNDGHNLNIILYVHGWQHGASSGDEDVKRLRTILASADNLESRFSHEKRRKTIGIYIGWRGRSWILPGTANLSFWSRKASALRVSHGAVQELFSRLRTVQNYYNNSFNSLNCAVPTKGSLTTGGCRVRTLMIGHSFGAWILYSAMAAHVIAALNGEKDINDSGLAGRGDLNHVNHSSENTIKIVNRRPADMIVLINPAFEAVRYQPVHWAAINYRTMVAQAPLLVTISSSGDTATRTFFPIGRCLNSIFQRPTTSVEQAKAMTRTHGNYGEYLTHHLSLNDRDTCEGWRPPGALSSDDRDLMLKNEAIERQNVKDFQQYHIQQNGLLKPWTRNFCGSLKLSLLQPTSPNHNRDPNTLVWNIRTDESIISTHSDIIDWRFLEFVRQLYADTDLRQ